MKNRFVKALVLSMVVCTAMTGSAAVFAAEEKTETVEAAEENTEESEQEQTGDVLKDGVYSAKFDTDSGMFHVNESQDGKGVLTVKDGKMTIHVSLVSKSILNLFPGLAEDAAKEGAELLEPTTDSVTYSDGYTEEVYGFDIPVPYLDKEFDVALIGKKGKWYDHKVSVSEAQPLEAEGKSVEDLKLEDGSYTVEVALEGGSGKATVESPAALEIKDGKASAVLVWSSPNYDYMLVDGEKYERTNTEGNSTFEIPVSGFDYQMPVVGNTVAMSTPHEIEYTLQFDSASVKEAN
ncbi:MAG: hypothetical protein Q4B00_01925 [Eubacteriales bacterium]|nr:hypothetical protein [Eubacteriales bacterium]